MPIPAKAFQHVATVSRRRGKWRLKCLAWGHLNRLLDSSKVQRSLEDGKEGKKELYSRMFSVVSSTVSVLRRLSANIKAPVSTVSRRRVAECSCPLVGSSLQAAWALGCSKLFTVSTIAWGSSRKNAVVTRRKPLLTLLFFLVKNAHGKMNAKPIHRTNNIVTLQRLDAAAFHLSCW